MPNNNSKPIVMLSMDRTAGFFYLAIILLGVWAELFVRSSLIVPGNAELTADNILAHISLFRFGIFADIVMILCDIAVAILLFQLFRSAAPRLALGAMIFRLLQASLIGASLTHAFSANILLEQASTLASAKTDWPFLALVQLETHAYGYDLSLVFFGVNCWLTGLLLILSNSAPKALGGAIILSGFVYFFGSIMRFLTPELHALIEPAYVIPLVTELLFAFWLLSGRISAHLHHQ